MKKEHKVSPQAPVECIPYCKITLKIFKVQSPLTAKFCMFSSKLEIREVLNSNSTQPLSKCY